MLQKLKWVDPGASRVVVGNSVRRKTWRATQLSNNDVITHRFCAILPGGHRVTFTATADGMLFISAISGSDDAVVAAAQHADDFKEVLQYDIQIGGKLAVFPAGINGADLKPVIATTPHHGLHRVFMSSPVSAEGAELAYVICFKPYAATSP